MKSIAHRIANIERKMKKVLWPVVIFYRSADGLSHEQQIRVDAAKAENRPVRLIKTSVVNG